MSQDTDNIAGPSRATMMEAQDLPPAWKCTEPYTFSLPQPEGDPWIKTLKPLIEADKAKCVAWTEEVQNLLIFAGLFSAVVTGFAVDSYKGLQQDPVVVLLAQIAAASGGTNNTSNSGVSDTLAAFAPSPSTVRLNIFLFVSLILSLATVLIGIVALQWLREHRHADEFFTPQTSFAMLHMRTEALKRWHVPEIFAALPLILQAALIVFLAAIVELLVDLGHNVIIPVGVVIGFTILFLVLTTILPTLQALLYYRPGARGAVDIPVPCPYKSSQSRAFRKLITSSHIGFLMASTICTTIFAFFSSSTNALTSSFPTVATKAAFFFLKEMVISSFYRLYSRIRTFHHAGTTDDTFDRYAPMHPRLDVHLASQTWPYIDLSWMSIRDNYFEANQPKGSWLFERRGAHISLAGVYDLTMGVCKEMLQESFDINAHLIPANFTDYHCMLSMAFPGPLFGQEGSGSSDSELGQLLIRRNQFMATCLKHKAKLNYSPLSLFNGIYDTASIDLIRDEDLFIILCFFGIKEDNDEVGVTTPEVCQPLAEVYHRLLGYLYARPQEMATNHCVREIPVPFNAELLWSMDYIYKDAEQPFSFQWAKTIHTFFESLAQDDLAYFTLAHSFHVHPFFQAFSCYFWKHLDREVREQRILPSSNAVRQVIATLQLITRIMEEIPRQVTELSAARVYAVAIHLQFYRQFPALSDFGPLAEMFQNMEPTLHRNILEVIAVRFQGTEDPDPKTLYGADQSEPGKAELYTNSWWRVLIPTWKEISEERPSEANHSVVPFLDPAAYEVISPF